MVGLALAVVIAGGWALVPLAFPVFLAGSRAFVALAGPSKLWQVSILTPLLIRACTLLNRANKRIGHNPLESDFESKSELSCVIRALPLNLVLLFESGFASESGESGKMA